MRILFAGSPGIAVPALEILAADKKNCFVAGLLTNADSPKGRSGKPEPTECAAAAGRVFANFIPILKPEKLNSEIRSQIAELKPDLLISFAYGKIFGPKFLALFPMGGINIHPSLLPKYRGPTPIPAAIINREAVTGITIQRLALEMDSGDILTQEIVPLDGKETTASLSEIMAKKAAELLPKTLLEITAGTIQVKPQDHNSATYCSLIKKDDGFINWNLSAEEIDSRIRAYDPWPLSWTKHGDLQLLLLKTEVAELNNDSQVSAGQVLGKNNDKGILIQTGKGVLAVSELQYRSKKALDWKSFLNGARNFTETRLG